MIAANLCHVLLTARPIEAVAKNLHRLKYAAQHLARDNDEATYADLLAVICEYASEHHTCPDRKMLLDFATTTSSGKSSDRLDVVQKGFSSLDEADESDKALTDISVVMETAVKKARILYQIVTADGYKIRAAGKEQIKLKGGGTRKSNIEDAKRFYRQREAKDLTDELPIPAGVLQENLDRVRDTLLSYQKDDAERIWTGFPHLDNFLVIGPKSVNRYIGILGYTGDGKTTFLNTLVYNMAAAGANILYVSLEHSPEETWSFLTFIHSHKFHNQFTLLPLTTWMQGKHAYPPITEKQFGYFNVVAEDLKKSLPGKIDCQRIWTWEGIVNHLESNQGEMQYTVVVIDYLDHLTMDGDARYHNDEVRKTIHAGQKLTQEFDNQQGIVLITPMQANREGNKAANKGADDDDSPHYNLNGVHMYSEYNQDMAHIFSVYSSDKMKKERKMHVETIKSRSGIRPERVTLTVDENSKKCVVPGVDGGTSISHHGTASEAQLNDERLSMALDVG